MRPAGKKKLGFYPCPERVIDMILTHISFRFVGHTAWLDPCAGEGEAIMRIRDRTSALVYGVEVADNRAAICRELPFTQFLQGNALSEVRYPRNAYDVLWFNPPYDWNHEFKRDEVEWFKTLIKDARVLKDGGLFIGILPVQALEALAPILLNYLDGYAGEEKHPYPTVLCFPDPEYDDFGQVVVFGQMRSRARYVVNDAHLASWIAQATSDDLAVLDFTDEPLWRLPHYDGNLRPPDMVSKVFQPAEGFRRAQSHGWFTRQAATDALWASTISGVETLRTLRPQHLATAIAAGFLNNRVVDSRPEGGSAQMVKGRTRKYLHTTVDHEAGPDGVVTTTQVEQFLSEVMAVDEDGTFTIYRLRKAEENE